MVKQQLQKKQSPNMEDYLEAIAILRGEEKVVRVSQIGRRLNVKMPSVTSALNKLSENGFVVHERYGYVRLTSQGDKVAKEVLRRHKVLTRFFAEALGVDPEIAEEDACKIEHVISSLSMERLTKFLQFIEACPLGEAHFPQRYSYYVEYGELPGECLERGLKKREQIE
jgi:DtxR family Mn-dependent transcriptional regulator